MLVTVYVCEAVLSLAATYATVGHLIPLGPSSLRAPRHENWTEKPTSPSPTKSSLSLRWQVAGQTKIRNRHSKLKDKIKMKKVLAVLLPLALYTSAAFASHDDDAVVRWKTIVGNITVSSNDAVGGISPGTLPWSTVGGRARVNLATGYVSFDVEGLVLNGGNATGTPGRR